MLHIYFLGKDCQSRVSPQPLPRGVSSIANFCLVFNSIAFFLGSSPKILVHLRTQVVLATLEWPNWSEHLLPKRGLYVQRVYPNSFCNFKHHLKKSTGVITTLSMGPSTHSHLCDPQNKVGKFLSSYKIPGSLGTWNRSYDVCLSRRICPVFDSGEALRLVSHSSHIGGTAAVILRLHWSSTHLFTPINIWDLHSSLDRVSAYYAQSSCFSPQHCINRAWWCTPVIPALWKWRQGGLGLQSHRLHSKYKASLCYMRPYLKIIIMRIVINNNYYK